MIFESKEQNLNRLKNVLIADKQFNPEQIKRVLRSDIFSCLSNYCVINPEALFVDIAVQENGSYAINITATCERLKIFGSLPD